MLQFSDTVKGYLLLLLVIAVIVYGSLYPFELHLYGSGREGLSHLLGTWRDPPSGRGDLIVNILLYMPIGFVAASLSTHKGRAVALAFVIGAVLSFSVEWLQFYDQSRVSCLSDFALNATGSLVGGLVSQAGILRLSSLRLPQGGPALFARGLLVTWLAWRLYPYVPTIDLHKYWDSLKPILFHPEIEAYDVFRFAVLWSGVSYLFRKALGPEIPLWLLAAAMTAYFGAKILILDQYLNLSEIAGAAVALFLSTLPDTRFKLRGLALLFTVMVIASRLLPWVPSPAIRSFQWVPFYSLLHGSLGIDTQSFCEKVFLYGTLLVLLVDAGLILALACLGECLMLVGTGALETLLVDRSAEITDAVIALFLALVYVALDRPVRRAALTRAVGAKGRRRSPG